MPKMEPKIIHHPTVMDSFHAEQDKPASSLHAPPIINPPPLIFGGGDPNGSPSAPDLGGIQYFTDDQAGGLDESHESKRRRVSRVWAPCTELSSATRC